MVTDQSLGRVFSHLGQPPMIGAIIAGILLGLARDEGSGKRSRVM